MFFSEWFGIDSDLIKGYGAVDISLVCDVPLFVDPMLIFNSENEIYKKLHKSIIRYFHFLYTKASQGLTPKEINAWFNFSEVPNNWLGYSLVGNKGNALGKEYANFLYKNISFAVNTHGISALGAGIDYVTKIGIEKMRDIHTALWRYFVNEAQKIKNITVYGVRTDKDDVLNAGIVSLNINGSSPADISTELAEAGVSTRAGFHCAPLAHKTLQTDTCGGTVRLSMNHLNTKNDVDKVLGILREMA